MNQTQTHNVMIGDTLTPLGVVLKQSDRAVDLSGKTVKVLGKTAAGGAWIAEGTTGVTSETAQTVTFATTWVTLVRHNLKAGDEVRFTTTGSLPSTLTAGTFYWVVGTPRPDAFQVASYPGGAAIDVSGSASGTHSVIRVGSVAYDFQTADVATAGTFHLYFKVFSGSEFDTFPNDSSLTDPKLIVVVGSEVA